ncbi:hypothetical protein [uncultured Sphaerochaeta sp.]|uniref:TolB family protein n=1 Tax=uncultured Sphaerochaeta sp. TaxID=886478 RepID=UPI002A0A6EF8|nr:hypothetical protein [uncultured Sphaerochaeta sp.]
MRKILLLILFLCSIFSSVFAYQQIETQHTRIIFEEDDQIYAQEVASFADEVYENLASYLDYESEGKVPVVMSGKTAWANGYYAPFPASIYLYITSPDNRFIGSRTSSWLKSLYTHELTHYLHLNAKVGPAKVLDFLGPGVNAFSTVFMPGWWIEGITTHTETAFAEGGRGDSLPFALSYQVPLQEGAMWSLAQGAYNGPFAPSGRIYVTGYLMVDYLIKTYGVDAFNTINRKFAAFPFLGLSPAFRKVTGYSAKELFTFALEERSNPYEAIEGEIISIRDKGNSYLPYETSLGLVGYRESPYDGSGLYRYKEGNEPERLFSLPISGRSSIALSDEIALLSVDSVDPTDPSSLSLAQVSYSDLYLLNLESRTSKRLTENQRLVHPSLSGDGNRAVASRISGSFYELVEIDLEEKSVDPLYKEERTSLLESSLNTDGSLLLFLALQEGNSSIKLLDQRGMVHTLVGPTQNELRSPLFTEDGSILFAGEQEGVFSVYRYDREGEETIKLFSDPAGIIAARINGDTLIYETYTPEGFALKSVGMDRVVHSTANFSEPKMETGTIEFASEYPVSTYRDRLRLNLVLPYPFIEANSIQPGLWFHATSNLRKQSLIGSIGYSFTGMRPVSNVVYQYAGGNYSLQLAGNLNTYDIGSATYLTNASVTVGLPVYYHSGFTAIKRISLQPSLSITTDCSDWAGAATLTIGGSSVSRDYRTIDFYGPSMSEVATGIQVLTNGDFSSQRYAAFASIMRQQRLFWGRHMARVSLSGITRSQGVGSTYPLFSFRPLGDGVAKIRLSASYLLPLGLLDIPFLYGGITKAGLELSAQTAWYLNDGTVQWEEAWAVGATLTGNLVMGGPSFAFQPFVRFAYLFGPDDWAITIGMNGQGILDFLPTPDHAPHL